MTFGFAPVQSEPRYDAMIAQARLAESFGFDTLWAHEHPSQATVYPDPLMTLAVLAHHTRTVRLGTNMPLLPRWHPIRVGHIACLMNFGRPPPDFVDASLRRFGKDILPHFQ